MKKQLPKPEYWQDFEDLCKNLWGQLWGIPLKIKKNGRSGQSQDGVDIYGVPKGQIDFWGIQCKGKDSYTNAELTVKEINVEVERAKNFKPKLAVFIIATTSNKDVKIEEYIRLLNIEHLQNDLFEVLLFYWEDIVDEILKRKTVLDYYLNTVNYNQGHGFGISINGIENSDLILNPKFNRGIITDKVGQSPKYNPRSTSGSVLNLMVDGFGSSYKKTMLNCCLLSFELTNTGNCVIEDWKFIVDFGDEFVYVDKINSGWKKNLHYHIKSSVDIDNRIVVFCDEKPLIQKDNRGFQVWITPHEKSYETNIVWKLLARDFSIDGTVNVIVIPNYEDKDLINEVKHQYEIKKPRPYTKPMISYEN
ncbi:hypothetical protein [Flavobacterium aquiphilum]|uniref:hypothetical protein n=1 Tax=Flavobacterium aquiphilum TaxID=3003261 RepID=UPI002480B0FA|nr:hypothetical protein [Flavobacterium aquiphilum]